MTKADIARLNNATLPSICAGIWSDRLKNNMLLFLKGINDNAAADYISLKDESAKEAHAPLFLWNQGILNSINDVVASNDDDGDTVKIQLDRRHDSHEVVIPQSGRDAIKKAFMDVYVANNLCVDVSLF